MLLKKRFDTLRSGVSDQATEENQETGPEDEGRGNSADSSTREEHTHGEHGERDEEQFPNLKEWLRKNGPQSEAAQAVMIDAAQILTEEGPLSASDLKERLFTQHPDASSSANALWEATIRRFYEETPGFERVKRGMYDFDDTEISDTNTQ